MKGWRERVLGGTGSRVLPSGPPVLRGLNGISRSISEYVLSARAAAAASAASFTTTSGSLSSGASNSTGSTFCLPISMGRESREGPLDRGSEYELDHYYINTGHEEYDPHDHGGFIVEVGVIRPEIAYTELFVPSCF